MRFLKLGLISAVFFFLLLTAFSILLPSKTNISRAIDINAPADTVFTYINDIKKWKAWYANYDSSKISYSPITVGKNASVTINTTTITLRKTMPGKIRAVWQTANNNPLEGDFNFIEKEPGLSMTLHWNFTQHVRWYPWEKFASIVSDKALGPFMERSLEKLKKEVEMK